MRNIYGVIKNKVKKYAKVGAICTGAGIGLGALALSCNEKGNINKPYPEIKEAVYTAVQQRLKNLKEKVSSYLTDNQLTLEERKELSRMVDNLYNFVVESDLLPEDKGELEKRIIKQRFEDAKKLLDVYLIDQQLADLEGEILDEEVEKLYYLITRSHLSKEDKEELKSRIKNSVVGKFENIFSTETADKLEKFLEQTYGKNIEVYGSTDGEEGNLTFLGIMVSMLVFIFYLGVRQVWKENEEVS